MAQTLLATIFRRTQDTSVKDREERIRVGRLDIRPARHQVLVDGESVQLTPMELAILCLLARRPGIVFRRDQILEAVHHDASEVTQRAVNTRVQELRKKLGEAGSMIKAVRGLGYALEIPESNQVIDQSPRWLAAMGGLLAWLGLGCRGWASTKTGAAATVGVGVALVIGGGYATQRALTPAVGGSDIQLLATVEVPGDARDASGLNEILADGRPHDRLGGFGSGIAYTGAENRFVAVCDRGPSEYLVHALARAQVFDLTPTPLGEMTFSLQSTVVLRDEDGRGFTGNASDLPNVPSSPGQRFDGEGIAIAANGDWYVVDEYGPSIMRFGSDGRLTEPLSVPAAFAVAHPATMPEDEMRLNALGRVRDRGFCGVTLAPSADRQSTLWTMTSSPLIQDGGRDGQFLRLLGLDLGAGGSRQYVYALDDSRFMASDVLAVDEHRLLVLETERGGDRYVSQRRIYMVNVKSATDVTEMRSLPSEQLPPGVRVAEKQLFLDLLAGDGRLPDASVDVAFESMAWGPEMEDGSRRLVVGSDNGLRPGEPTWLLVFRVPDSALDIR